jgi:hypothetical protein
MFYAECLYAECHYAECHFTECVYVKSHYTESRYPKCLYAECLNAKSHYAECHYSKCLYAECLYAECRDAPSSAIDLKVKKKEIFWFFDATVSSFDGATTFTITTLGLTTLSAAINASLSITLTQWSFLLSAAIKTISSIRKCLLN